MGFIYKVISSQPGVTKDSVRNAHANMSKGSETAREMNLDILDSDKTVQIYVDDGGDPKLYGNYNSGATSNDVGSKVWTKQSWINYQNELINKGIILTQDPWPFDPNADQVVIVPTTQMDGEYFNSPNGPVDLGLERILAHELDHVKLNIEEGPTRPSNIEDREDSAIENENKIGEELGEPENLRDDDIPGNPYGNEDPITPINPINPVINDPSPVAPLVDNPFKPLTGLPSWIPGFLDDWFDAGDAPVSPLVLDLDGDGIELASVLSDDAVYWDIDQDGFGEASGWITGGDGLLAIDLNGDGIINDHGELFGNETTDGFSVLLQYDSNADGLMNANDAQWGDLLVWVDGNSNGYSDDGELHTLNDLGITEINLSASLVDYDIEGNAITHESTFTINGQERTIVDAWFEYDNTNSIYVQDYTLNNTVLFLPKLRGFGDVADLHIAMSIDETLLDMVMEIALVDNSTLFSSTFDLDTKMDAIMFRWGGVNGVDPASRGENVDARKLEFLENFFGDEFIQNVSNPNPHQVGGPLIETLFNNMKDTFISHLVVQGNASGLYDNDAYYDAFTGNLEGADIGMIRLADGGLDARDVSDGDDVYVFTDQLQSLSISENVVSEDSIWLSGLSADDIRFIHTSGIDKDLEIHIGNEVITINNQYWSDSFPNGDEATYRYEVETLLLDDGSIIDLTANMTFTGTSGAETIQGLNLQDDTIIGLEGDDYLHGQGGNDILEGGAGNDDLHGGGGDDTYIWNLGDGSDTISENLVSTDQLVLHNVELDDLRFIQTSGIEKNLEIYVGTDVITINNQHWSDAFPNSDETTYRYEIETLLLDDGTVVDLTTNMTFTGTSGAETIQGLNLQDDTIIGLGGDDYLLGQGGNDVLEGGTGTDALHGGYDDDTYVWSVGDGNDTIYESAGQDTLVLQDVLQSEVTLTTSVRHLYIDIGSERITVDNHFLDNGNDYRIETIEFSDGSQLDLGEYYNEAPIAQDDAFIGDQDVDITGNVFADNGNGADSDDGVFDVTAGTYATSNGSVTVAADGSFVYTPNTGYNGADSFTYTITDEYGVTDTATVDLTVRAPNVVPNAADDAFIGNQDESITGNLLSDNGNGTDSDPDGDPLSVVSGTYATTHGSVAVSSNGAFTYTPEIGYFGADSFTYTLEDDRGGSDTATANITLSEVVSGANTIYGTAAADTLNGDVAEVSDDTLIGLAGNDTLNGKLGNDVYEWSVGDGNDQINETGGVDQLVLHGVTVDDIRIEKYGSYDLRVHIDNEYIEINYQMRSDTLQNAAYDTYQVESILFDDGTTIDLTGGMEFTGTVAADSIMATSQDDELYGLVGNDTLYGGTGNDTLVGGTGNDTLNGQLGNDVYEWSVGDGNDQINETGGVDQLVLHGVIADDIRFEKYGSYDLRVHIDNEYIELNYQMRSDTLQNSAYDTYHVESILLDDGTTIDLTGGMTFTGTVAADSIMATSQDDELYGLVGNDTLYGGTGNDTLVGGTGNDTLNGQLGSDVYEWSVGDGNDQINETGGVDQLVLHGVTADDIRFEKYGSYDLRVHINNEYIEINYQMRSDTLQNSAYDTYHVESILLDDGTTIDLTGGMTFTGTANADSIMATYQNDELYGLVGNDTLYGGQGNDTLVGGVGNDTLNGQLGNDVYEWSVGDGNDQINETGGVDQLALHGVTVDDVRLEKYGSYDLRVHIDNECIEINYQMRSDTLQNAAYDTYQVESILLDDGTTIDLTGGMAFTGTTAADSITATIQNDELYGLGGSDTLYGGLGDDTLYGGGGVDMLYGQGGADIFAFEADSAFTNSDNIQDFNLSDGDALDISDILSGYDPLTDAITDFVQITESGSNSYLNVDADGGADNFVQIAYLYNAIGLTDEEALETAGDLIAA